MALEKVQITAHKDGTATILFDGQDVSKNLRGVEIHIKRGLPTLIAEYICYGQMVIEGEMDIVHVCPKGGRK